MARTVAVLKLLGVCALVMMPAVGMACPSCVNTQEANRTAYIVTTAILTFAPLLMMGGLMGWLWRQAKKRQAAAAPEQAALSGSQVTTPASV